MMTKLDLTRFMSIVLFYLLGNIKYKNKSVTGNGLNGSIMTLLFLHFYNNAKINLKKYKFY